MVYHKVSLSPSEGQMMALAEGNSTKLEPEHLAQKHTFHLTTAQLKKLEAAAAKGKGCLIKFSATQLKHHLQHGKGVFHDMLKALVAKGYQIAKPLVRKGVNAAINY